MTDIGDSVLNVRNLVDDVAAAVDFYTTHLGFGLRSTQLTTFVDVTCGHPRLLLAGPTSSAARPMPDGRQPGPRNRIHLISDDIAAEEARLRTAGVGCDIIIGPGGRDILLDDAASNPIELFTSAAAR